MKSQGEMNRLQTLFSNNKKILSIYFTAGYPALEDTEKIIVSLANAGVDCIEIGLPFSDPLADGPTIQQSSEIALTNGMHTRLLFEQLKNIRQQVNIPLIIMGYFNPMLQYGMEAFLAKCKEVGIDGLIIPDLPLAVYTAEYQTLFEKNRLHNIFLITPQTSEERIRQIDAISTGFIYMVSSAGTTGSTTGFGEEQTLYFNRVSSMQLHSPLVVGFGVKDKSSFAQATELTNGAIIGSAFIKMLAEKGVEGIEAFVKAIR